MPKLPLTHEEAEAALVTFALMAKMAIKELTKADPKNSILGILVPMMKDIDARMNKLVAERSNTPEMAFKIHKTDETPEEDCENCDETDCVNHPSNRSSLH